MFWFRMNKIRDNRKEEIKFRNRYAGDWQRHRCPKRLSQIPVARKDCQIVWTAFHRFKRYSTDLPWSPPCLVCASGINRKRNYGFTRSTRPITEHERTAMCKSQLEAIIKKPGNTQGVGTSFWSLIRRQTIPGLVSSATQASVQPAFQILYPNYDQNLWRTQFMTWSKIWCDL